MLKKILAKISFFGALLFGLCLFSGCGQSTVSPILPQQTPTSTFTQSQQTQPQVNTTTRAS